MDAALCVLAVCGLASSLLLLLRDARRRRRDALLAERLRVSVLYATILDALAPCRAAPIDEIRLERSQLIICSIYPQGALVRFDLGARGFRHLPKDRLRALLLLITEEFPELCDGGKYRFSSYNVFRPNGRRDRAYSFVIRTAYKDWLMLEKRVARI